MHSSLMDFMALLRGLCSSRWRMQWAWKDVKYFPCARVWFVFPGGRPHVVLYVPGGNLVFALFPDGLRSGFVGRCCFQDSIVSEMGPCRTSVFLKGSSAAVVALISNYFFLKRLPWFHVNGRWGWYVEFFEARWNTRKKTSVGFIGAHFSFRASIMKSHSADADL